MKQADLPQYAVTEGPEGAFAIGPMSVIQTAAFNSDVDWVLVMQLPTGRWFTRAGRGEPTYRRDDDGKFVVIEDYWGNGPTLDIALRYLYGSVLDLKEES